MGHVLAIRSEYRSLFSIGVFSNKPLLVAVVVALILQYVVTFVPFFQPIFKTEALSLMEFLVVGGASMLVFFAVEAEKWISRRRGQKTKRPSKLF
jgi:Ca2+-transporting ATPase